MVASSARYDRQAVVVVLVVAPCASSTCRVLDVPRCSAWSFRPRRPFVLIAILGDGSVPGGGGGGCGGDERMV